MDYLSATEKLVHRLEELDAERKEILALLSPLERAATQLSAAQESLATGSYVPEPPTDSGILYDGIPIDFTGVSNLGDRVIAMARAVGGTLHSMDMAKCLIARGQSQGSPDNVRSRIINLLKDHPSFVKEGPSRFRFIGDDSSMDSFFPPQSPQEGSNSGSSML